MTHFVKPVQLPGLVASCCSINSRLPLEERTPIIFNPLTPAILQAAFWPMDGHAAGQHERLVDQWGKING